MSKKIFSAIILVSCLPFSLAAEAPGLAYGTPAGCDLHSGGQMPASDGIALWNFSEDMLIIHETICQVTSSSMLGNGDVSLSAACYSEGEKWDAWYSLIATENDRQYIIFSQDNPHFRADLFQCD